MLDVRPIPAASAAAPRSLDWSRFGVRVKVAGKLSHRAANAVAGVRGKRMLVHSNSVGIEIGGVFGPASLLLDGFKTLTVHLACRMTNFPAP